MPDLELIIHQTEQTPKVVEENLDRIRSYTENLLMGRFEGTHMVISFPSALTNFKVPHGLNFTPKDIIQTALTGAGTITWNYSLFDSENLDVTTSAACEVRAFVGVYDNEREE